MGDQRINGDDDMLSNALNAKSRFLLGEGFLFARGCKGKFSVDLDRTRLRNNVECSVKWHFLLARQCWLPKKRPTTADVTLSDPSTFVPTIVSVAQA